MMKEEYLKAIEKLALGYEYEEVQTQIEETSIGTKKKIIKTKKHVVPNFQAIKYLIEKEKPKIVQDNSLEELPKKILKNLKLRCFNENSC